MRGLFQALVFILVGAVVSGCNTTDALTPKADVPNEPPADVSVQDNTAVRPVAETAADSPVDNSVRAPQNTLEAQRQAMEGGVQNTTPDAQADNSGLGANLYKSDSAAKPSSSLYSSTPSKNSVRFLPIIGAPVQAVTPLSKELGETARSNGLSIKSSNDPTAQHVLKGYLSAFSDGKNVTVVYVWDILDTAGGRLHRIQGQESTPAKGDDAWSSVPPELMREIGVSTIAEYMKWLQAQG